MNRRDRGPTIKHLNQHKTTNDIMETGIKTKGTLNQQTVELIKETKAIIPLATGNKTFTTMKVTTTTTTTKKKQQQSQKNFFVEGQSSEIPLEKFGIVNIDPKINNLSNAFSKEDIEVLEMGFKFTPTPNPDNQTLKKDIDELNKLRLREFFGRV